MQGCVRLTEKLLNVASCSRESGKLRCGFDCTRYDACIVRSQMTMRRDVTEETGS